MAGPVSAGQDAGSGARIIEDGTGNGLSDARNAFYHYHHAHLPSERRRWLCIAVNSGDSAAQSELARLHWPRPGASESPFRRDMQQAYAWSLIAIRNGQPLEHMEQRLASAMTRQERWEATLMAASWKPDPGGCGQVGASGCLHVR